MGFLLVYGDSNVDFELIKQLFHFVAKENCISSRINIYEQTHGIRMRRGNSSILANSYFFYLCTNKDSVSRFLDDVLLNFKKFFH